jgi:ubiquinone/menaquinone biosynthesis C-methylase UbiE
MRIAQSLLMRMFGRSQGALGRLGGLTMARGNYDRGTWVIDPLEIRPNDRVLEVGFGSGVLIQRVAAAAASVAGADLSQEMVEQVRARNAGVSTYAAAPWRVCRMILIPSMQAPAVNSFQVWQNAVAGLREIHRVMKPMAGSRLPLRRIRDSQRRG